MSAESAWERIHENLPNRWFVGRPGYDDTRRQWTQYAYDPHEVSKVGRRSREWAAIGQSELEVLEEMGRCLGEIKEGRTPQ